MLAKWSNRWGPPLSSIQVTVDIYGHLLENRKPEEAAKTDRLVFGQGQA